MRRFRVILVGLFLVLASTAAFATDGVIEINQARALAGGVTAGDTAGFPVTISVSGSYRLTSNLTIATSNTDMIDVTAPDVTIDLNGFAILGPVVCSSGTPTTCTGGGAGYGINATLNRITVRNGAVKGMGNAINASGNYQRIENVCVSQNGSGGIYAGYGSVIVGCIADVNGSYGILTGDSLIQNCTAVYNAGTGISEGSFGGVISGCVSQDNNQGISVGQNALVTGSTATNNTSFGLLNGAGSAYSNCLFAGNNGANPEVSGGIQIGTNICNGAACP